MGNGSILSKRFFFVAQTQSGSIKQGCADSTSTFLASIKKADISWLDYTVDDVDKEVFHVAEQFGFSKSLVDSLVKERHAGYEDVDKELGLKLPAITVENLEVVVNPIFVLMNERRIITIHGHKLQRFLRFRRYADVYMRKIPRRGPTNDRLTLLLIRLLDENNGRNFDHLREIEEQSDTISKWMMDPETPRSKLGPEIYKMKHALIVYLNSLWSNLDVVNSLRNGDAELISDNKAILGKIEFLSNEINRQIELSEHMSEVLASGLEVLQSIYNNQLQVLNNRMALAITYLTIVGTAVLVPNTIGTVLSNSAFAMTAADQGWYLALILGSTLVSTFAVYWWVKQQQWLPKKTHD